MGTVFDDVVLRQLEQQYKGVIPIIYCTLNEKRCKGWSGFVVSKLPMIILTVSHGVRHYNNDLLEAESSFYVKFYADCNYYRADAIRWDHRSDLLVLTCQRPVHDPSPFSFVDPDIPFSTSTSLFSISTAGDREWRMIRGSVCSPPFLKGQYPSYHHDLTQFDHDVQLYPGGSGATLIDLMGQVFGMQTSEITCKEHVFCVAKDYRKRVDKYTIEDVAGIYRTINELVFRPSNLKQATPVHELAKRLKEMFLEDGIDPHTGLTSFLRQSVNIFILRKKEAAQGAPTQSPTPSPATSSGQDPQSSTRPPKKPRLHERSRVGMVDYMPECYGEQDEVSLANVNCQSDQEDMGAFAGMTGCLQMFNSSEKQIRMVLDTKEKMMTKSDPDGLLASKPIQVHIVRANPSSQIDGPIGFLNLGACVIGFDNDHQEKDLEITEMAREKHLERYSPCHTVQERVGCIE